LDSVFDDFDVDAVKTGMLATADVVKEVARTIATRGVPIVVVDPVLRSSSGFDLALDETVGAYSNWLFPLATLVTPNAAEAERFTGVPTASQAGKRRAAREIVKTGAGAVLITGGDPQGDSEPATDLLIDEQGEMCFSAERIKSNATHGTGCALSSALACLLAGGRSLRDAIPIAKEYVRQAIASAPGLGRGRGPMNHFPPGLDC
jgi:hydroxymethylpyrimidine/phosphomethylpyrimidine kinase